MTFIAAAVLWGGYTMMWWGWLAVTDHVPPGPPDTFHWPSIIDLVSPGRIGQAIPGRAKTTFTSVNPAENPNVAGPVRPGETPARESVNPAVNPRVAGPILPR